MFHRIILILSLLCCLPIQPAARGDQVIGRLALDDARHLGLTLTTDRTVKVEGNGAIRIETTWPTAINLGEITGIAIDNSRVIYRARVRTEDLLGTAYLEMWCTVDGGQYFSRGMQSMARGTSDWQTLETDFRLLAGQAATRYILNLVINGKGTVWVDQIELVREDLGP